MNNIKITIITITLNSEKTVEKTIKSIISQNYSNLEYIIIDGGSTDKTIEIVNKYSSKISKIISERDEGISDAFNKGIRLATGDVIGIINSDDILLPGALSALEENFEPNVDVYRGNTIIWNDKNDLKVREIPSMKFKTLHFFLKVSHQSTFITKLAYQKYGLYKKNYKFLMDVDLLTRFYNHKAKFKYINHDIALYRMGGITSTNIWRKKREMKDYIMSNNGKLSDFLIYFGFNVLIYYTKLIINLFDANASRKLRNYLKLNQ